MTYKSGRSGRTIGISAKTERLPLAENDDIFNFCFRQLILTPKEQAREFSRVYFLEKRARQEAWLAMGKSSRNSGGAGDVFLVSQGKIDSLEFSDYVIT